MHRALAPLSLFFAFLLLSLPGCSAAGLGETVRNKPAYTRTAEHYRAFADAEALAAYLRVSSDAGPLVSAHRGGPMPAYPENALATFEHTLRFAPALIECDVRQSRDSVLVMLHDETLDRTTTGTGYLRDYTLPELRQLLLKDEHGVITPFRIPTLAETLAWAEDRAVLTLDIKPEVAPGHLVNLIRRLHAENRVILIVYTLDDLLTYTRLAPDLNISATAETVKEAQTILDSGVDQTRLMVFTGVGAWHPEVIDLLHRHDVRAILGTFDLIDGRAQQAGPEVFQALIDQGIDVIATDVVPLAAQAVSAYQGR